uniref:Uncharacterized protein n=1 Tax=Oryza rufipogon TaxID=4529 RepID=A0A0E0P4Z2_ORYRU
MRRGALVDSPLLGPNVGAGLGQGAAMPVVHLDSGRLQQPPSGFCLHNVRNLPLQFTSTHLEGSRIRTPPPFCLHDERSQPLSTFWLSHAGTITHSYRLVLRRLSAPLGS